MADKFIQMAQRNVGNTDWDNLYPQDKFETAGGTATAITLTIPNLVDGVSKTFIASTNNNGLATTINGKNLYKPNTTTAPTLIAGKAYTVWYSASNDCFFIKASAEGDAVAGDVLAGKTFSNGEDTDIIGILDLNKYIYFDIINAGDIVLLSNSNIVGNFSLAYELAKQFQINFSGIIRVKFDLCVSESSSHLGYGQIYKNGNPVGIERTTSSVTPVSFSEDISFNKNDIIQLYLKCDPNSTSFTRNSNFSLNAASNPLGSVLAV